jgi:hypothetical protein
MERDGAKLVGAKVAGMNAFARAADDATRSATMVVDRSMVAADVKLKRGRLK